MPTQQTPAIRIFCLCGQKMRVTEPMYGRRARCVACQLKVRIPRFEEIPQGASELYLHDHPELIREKKSAEPAAPENGGAKRRAKPSIVVPIEPSQPLQQICSLDKKLKSELAQVDGVSKAQVEAYRTRLEDIRAAFEDEVHQRLMETAIELTAAQEKLAELHLGARVGEIDYREYREQANRVRWRRECLEKRQINLRAWLAVRDADLAGGYIDVPLTRMDDISIRMPMLEDSDEPEVLLQWMVEQLRSALATRKQAEAQRDIISQMRQNEEIPEEQAKRSAKQQKAMRARATAAARFWRDRLKHHKKDIRHDQRVVEAQLELAHGRRQLGELDRGQYDVVARELRRAKADLEKAMHSLERALAASNERQLPALRGTFLARLGTAPPPSKGRKTAVFAILGLVFMGALVLWVILSAVYGYSPLPRFGGDIGTEVWQMEPPLQPRVVTEPPAEAPSVPTPAEEPSPEPGDPEPLPVEPYAPLPEETAEPEAEPYDPQLLPDDDSAVEDAPDEPGVGVTIEEPAPREVRPYGEPVVEAELRGLVTSADRAPRFSLRIYTNEGIWRDRVRELGDSIVDGWVIREYNPRQQSITLFDGENLLVLRRGEREYLPPPSALQDR